jgi:hypothetical protein
MLSGTGDAAGLPLRVEVAATSGLFKYSSYRPSHLRAYRAYRASYCSPRVGRQYPTHEINITTAKAIASRLPSYPKFIE